MTELFAYATFFVACAALWNVLAVKQMLKQHDERAAGEGAGDGDGELDRDV